MTQPVLHIRSTKNAIISVTSLYMKSRLRVLPLRLAPLDYTMRAPLNFALEGRGSIRFFEVSVLVPCNQVGRSHGRVVAAVAGTAVTPSRASHPARADCNLLQTFISIGRTCAAVQSLMPR